MESCEIQQNAFIKAMSKSIPQISVKILKAYFKRTYTVLAYLSVFLVCTRKLRFFLKGVFNP